MTQDEIIEMVIQFGIPNHVAEYYKDELEAFAKLVAAKAIAKLKSQEPVAWAHYDTFKNLDSLTRARFKATLATKKTDACCIPLYTHPPQRTWVGLASEDRLTAKYMQDAPDGIEAVIDYIESKLKELNT